MFWDSTSTLDRGLQKWQLNHKTHSSKRCLFPQYHVKLLSCHFCVHDSASVKATFVGVGPSVEWLMAVGASSMYLCTRLSPISVPTCVLITSILAVRTMPLL